MSVSEGHGAKSGTAPVAAAAAAMPNQTTTLRDLIIVAFYHQRMIATVLLFGMVVAFVAWAASPVRYTAKVQLLVLFGREQSGAQGLDAPTIFSVDGIRVTNSEVEFLRDRNILRRMVEIIGPARIDLHLGKRRLLGLLPPVPPEEELENAVDLVDRWLKITAPSDSNLVQVAFQHENRQTAIEAADVLVDVYLRRRSEIYRNLRSPVLKDKVQGYAQQLNTIEEEIRSRKERLNVLNLDQEILLALNQVDSVQQRRQNQSERLASLKAEIAATQDRLTEIPAQVFDFSEKTDRVDNDDTDNQLIKLYLEQERLKLYYKDSEPKLIELGRQISLLEGLRRKPRRQFFVDREVRNPAKDFITNHLMQLRVEGDAAAQSVAELDEQVETSQKRVTELRDAENILHGLERSRQVVEQLYREVSQRAEAAQIEEEAAAVKTANIRIVENADASLRGTSEGMNLALAILAGDILLAGVLTLLAGWNRQVFILPDEVEQALGLPVLATFNAGQDFNRGGTTSQIIFLTGQLMASRPPDAGPFTIQIVSTDAMERRSDFAEALAKELAGGQNQRTLLLDLVKDGSDQWTAFGQPALREGAAVGTEVAPTAFSNLDVSVRATISEINWLRADGEVLRRLFEALGKAYDMVVIDTPPIRESLIGVRLASIVDGSIVVVRAEHTRVPGAENLCAQILGAGGDMFGAILTERKFRIPKAIYRWF